MTKSSPSNITTISNRSRSMSLADSLYSGEYRSILWTIVVGQIKKILSSSPSPPTFSSVWKNGSNSPSLETWNISILITMIKHTIRFLLYIEIIIQLLFYLPLDHLSTNVSLDDMTLAHITDAKHKARLIVSLTNDSITRKE